MPRKAIKTWQKEVDLKSSGLPHSTFFDKSHRSMKFHRRGGRKISTLKYFRAIRTSHLDLKEIG